MLFARLSTQQKEHIREITELISLKDKAHDESKNLSHGQKQWLKIGMLIIQEPEELLVDEPTEGIQPSVIKDIHNVITILKQQGEIAIVLVEQYFDFARDLGDSYAVMDRGRVADMNAQEVRQYLTV